MGEHQGVDDDVFTELGRASFHHDDGVAADGHHEVEVRLGAVGEGRVDDQLALDATDANAGVGTRPGDIRKMQGRGRARHGEHVGGILAVGRNDHGDDLGVEPPALREQRARGAVDEARGEDFGLRHPAFALEVAARDPASGRGLLEVVDGEGHEVHPRTDRHRRHGRHEHHGVAVADHHRPVGLLGHAAGLDAELLAAEIDAFTNEHVGLLCLGSCSLRTRSARAHAPEAHRRAAHLRRMLVPVRTPLAWRSGYLRMPRDWMTERYRSRFLVFR